MPAVHLPIFLRTVKRLAKLEPRSAKQANMPCLKKAIAREKYRELPTTTSPFRAAAAAARRPVGSLAVEPHGGLLEPEGVESSLIGVVARDGLDCALADKDQLASSDVERAFAAGRGRPLDGRDVGAANGDVEQLGSEGAPGQRSQLLRKLSRI